MQNSITTNLKSQFTTYLSDNFNYDYLKVQEHAELSFKNAPINDKPNSLINSVSRIDYVIDRVFDLINDYTEIDFDDPSSLVDLDFESILDKDYEYGDGAADIYFYSLYQSCNLFSDVIEDAIQSYDKMELWKLIQIAQSNFYNNFYRWSIETLQSFVEEIQDEEKSQFTE
jgi:hypothetical protein